MSTTKTKVIKKNENKKDWKPIILYICMQGAIIITSIVIVSILLGTRMSQGGELDPEAISNDSSNTTATTIAMASMMAIAFVVFLVMYRKRIKDDFKRLTGKQWGLLVLAGVALLLINAGLSTLLETMGVEMSNQDNLAESMGALLVPTAVMTAVLAPVVEEFVFRYSLGSLIKNPIVFVIVSSLLFAVLHAMNAAIILYIVLGLFFSLAYIKTDKNIVASIFLHFFNNFIGTIGLILLALGIE